MSFYTDYIAERNERESIETEDGFITFDFLTNDIVYIVDLYVVPEKRRAGIASKLADLVCQEALKRGVTTLLSSVDTHTKGAKISHQVMLAYGMKAIRQIENGIYYTKKIEQGACNGGS